MMVCEPVTWPAWLRSVWWSVWMDVVRCRVLMHCGLWWVDSCTQEETVALWTVCGQWTSFCVGQLVVEM